MGRSRALRGVTLVEALVAAAGAVLVLLVVLSLWQRSISLGDATNRAIGLQSDARAFLDRLARDVNFGHRFLLPEGGDGTRRLTIVRYGDVDPLDRVNLNVGGAGAPSRQTYPFVRSVNVGGDESGSTVHQTPARLCRYVFDEAAGTVTRTETEGILRESNTAAAPHLLAKLTFDARGEEKTEVLATDVERLEFTHLAYKPPSREEAERGVTAGRLVRAASLEPADFDLSRFPVDEAAFRIQQTACVAVRFAAAFERGVYGDPNRRTPRIEVLTKVWCYERLKDETHQAHFGSMDADLRF